MTHLEEFNATLGQVPYLTNELVKAINCQLWDYIKREHALKILNAFQALTVLGEFNSTDFPHVDLQGFEIHLTYEECNVNGILALDAYVDHLCEEINHLSSSIKFYRSGSGSCDSFQALIPIDWKF